MEIDSFDFSSSNFEVIVDMNNGSLKIITKNSRYDQITIAFDEIIGIIEVGKRTYEALEKV